MELLQLTLTAHVGSYALLWGQPRWSTWWLCAAGFVLLGVGFYLIALMGYPSDEFADAVRSFSADWREVSAFVLMATWSPVFFVLGAVIVLVRKPAVAAKERLEAETDAELRRMREGR